MASTYRKFFIAMAVYWLGFGLGTTFYPRMMQMFMTPEGIAASTPFSNQVWLHGGLDILSVCVLLLALSGVPATRTTLRAAGIVGVFPVVAMLYTLATTPFWAPLFLVPAAGCFAFGIYGFVLAGRAPATSR